MKSNIKYLQSDKQRSFDKKSEEIHKNELGLEIPKDYFKASKEGILDKVNDFKKESNVFSFNKKRVIWFYAAGITLLITFSIYRSDHPTGLNEIQITVSDTLDQIKGSKNTVGDFFAEENDITIASLFVEDAEIDEYLDNHILEDMMRD